MAFASAHGGTWAEYGVAPAMGCILLRKTVSLEQGASLIVNPLTAVAFFEMARRGRHTAIINNAAASALGRMIIRLGRRAGVPVINIGRRPHHVNLLEALDAEYVLDSSDARFVSALGELAHRLHATLAFDAVGGKQTQWLTDAMPFGSTIVVYAGLAGEPSVFNPRTLAGDDKTIIGFYLRNWMAQRGVLPLSTAQRALESYRADMTAGKVLLVPGASEAMDGRHEPSVA